MRKEAFEASYKKIVRLEHKIKLLSNELEQNKELIMPYIQFHLPLITISTLKEKYWHCNSPIIINGKITRHSVYLGSKDKFEGKTDPKLVKLAEKKMGEFLRKKYPHMFE